MWQPSRRELGILPAAALVTEALSPSTLEAGVVPANEPFGRGLSSLWKATVEKKPLPLEHIQMCLQYTDGSTQWLPAKVFTRTESRVGANHEWSAARQDKQLAAAINIHTHAPSNAGHLLQAEESFAKETKQTEYERVLTEEQRDTLKKNRGKRICEPPSPLDLRNGWNILKNAPAHMRSAQHLAGVKVEAGLYIQERRPLAELKARFGKNKFFIPNYIEQREQLDLLNIQLDKEIRSAIDNASHSRVLTAWQYLSKSYIPDDRVKNTPRILPALTANDPGALRDAKVILSDLLTDTNVFGMQASDQKNAIKTISNNEPSIISKIEAREEVRIKTFVLEDVLSELWMKAATQFRFHSMQSNGNDTLFIQSPLGRKLFIDLQACAASYGQLLTYASNDRIPGRDIQQLFTDRKSGR